MVYDQQPSFLTTKVVGQDGDAFWIESLQESYSGRTVTKILLSIPNRMDPGSVEIRGVVMKDRNGHVNTLEGPVLSMMQGLYRGAVANLIVSWQGQPQEDASVPAGTFIGCFKMRTDAQWGGWKSASMSWSHPAVPLSGMVRSDGIDKPSSMELVRVRTVGRGERALAAAVKERHATFVAAGAVDRCHVAGRARRWVPSATRAGRADALSGAIVAAPDERRAVEGRRADFGRRHLAVDRVAPGSVPHAIGQERPAGRRARIRTRRHRTG